MDDLGAHPHVKFKEPNVCLEELGQFNFGASILGNADTACGRTKRAVEDKLIISLAPVATHSLVLLNDLTRFEAAAAGSMVHVDLVAGGNLAMWTLTDPVVGLLCEGIVDSTSAAALVGIIDQRKRGVVQMVQVEYER